jgi:hypothetical protein
MEIITKIKLLVIDTASLIFLIIVLAKELKDLYKKVIK